MISADVKTNLNPPNLNLQEEFRQIAKTIVIPLLAEGINNQIAIDGTPLKPNDPKYTDRKRKKGLSEKVLIATGKLYRSFIYKDQGSKAVIVTMNSERKTIGGYQFHAGKNFFGVTKRMENSAVNYMKQRIKAILNGK